MGLTYVEQETHEVPVTLDDNTTAGWLRGRFKIRIEPNADRSAYVVSIWTALRSDYDMSWSGAGTMHCTVTWRDTNNAVQTQYQSVEVNTPLYGKYWEGAESVWDGPAVFNFSTKGAKSITFNIDDDLLRTICDTHGQAWGPDYVNAGKHFQHFYLTDYVINVEGIPLITRPVLGSLSNENKYDNNAGISASETSITVGYTRSGGDAETKAEYKLDQYPNNWSLNPAKNPFTQGGISSGTPHTCSLRIGNDAGWSEWKSITIRTLYPIPTISISSKSKALEDFSISWSSNRSIQTVQYSLDGGGWITYADGINATSGTITVSAKNGEDLYPNTSYTIKVRVKSTNTYDHRWSSDSSTITMTTLDRARLTSSANLTFGQPLQVTKTNPSGNKNQVKIQVGNPLLLIKTQDSPSNNYNISFTQAELDNSYKKFPNPANSGLTTAQHNQIAIRVTLITFGRSRNYTVDYDGTLTLTGDALTARTNVNGTIRRAKVWTRIGSETNPRRGVAWISTSTGVWRRGI